MSVLLAWVRIALSLVIAATMRERPSVSIACTSDWRTASISRTRSLWMIASISAAAVITMYCCVLTNRNRPRRNSAAPHNAALSLRPGTCAPALMAARTMALLTPPSGHERQPREGFCISRRMRRRERHAANNAPR